MVNLFYYSVMGVIWFMVLAAFYNGLGALFWPFVGAFAVLMFLAARNQAPRA